MPDIDPLAEWEENKHDVAWFSHQRLSAQQAGKSLIPYIYELLEQQVSEEDIGAQYDLLINADGTIGEALPPVGGPPIKRDLLGKAIQTSPQQALAEFLDNLLDNYDDNHTNHGYEEDLDVEVTITVYDDNPIANSNNNGAILLKENSGGVREDKWDALVQIGNSDWDSIDHAVGTWGNGVKVALAALGRHNQFSTYHESSEPIVMQFGSADSSDENGGIGDEESRKLPENYYHEKNDWWHITPHKLTGGWCTEQSGRSLIYIRRLTQSALDTFQDNVKYENMVSYLRNIFQNKIRELETKTGKPINIEIINVRLSRTDVISEGAPAALSGDLVEERKKLTFIPGVEPIHLNCQLQSEGQIIDVEILVGMPIENIQSESGFRMWGNGRLFEKNFTDFETPGAQYPNWDRGQTPEGRRVSGYIKIQSDNAANIPWKGPVKWGFDRLSRFSDLILQLMSYSITRYTNTSAHLARAAMSEGEALPPILKLFSTYEGDE